MKIKRILVSLLLIILLVSTMAFGTPDYSKVGANADFSGDVGVTGALFESVTAKTTTALLTVAESGTILVSAAGGAYTITLPTAVGNTGLTYHFIKTDANYTLITLAANGAQTFNYESSTGAPVATYARLNTYCAEVTVVSDGSNWQCINERLGQVPFAWMYMSRLQPDFPLVEAILRISLDTVQTNIGSNINVGTWITGTARATTANHLIDTTNNPFTSVMLGCEIKNTTDGTYAMITVVNSTSDVTLSKDIFINTEGYLLKYAEFAIPISGQYRIDGYAYIYNGEVAQQYNLYIYSNGAVSEMSSASYPSAASQLYTAYAGCTIPLIKGDYIELRLQPYGGTISTVDVYGASKDITRLTMYLVSKD